MWKIRQHHCSAPLGCEKVVTCRFLSSVAQAMSHATGRDDCKEGSKARKGVGLHG